MTSRQSTSPLNQIHDHGYALIRLNDSAARHLAALHEASTAFFDLATEAKLRHSGPNRTTGYRPFAYAHAGDLDHPDLNDSFLYWGAERKLPENPDGIRPFLTALESYRVVSAQITADLIRALAAEYDYRHELPFEDASVLQVNSYGSLTEEELYQQPHEDADFLTVLWGSEKGLEGVRQGEILPFEFGPDEVLVMPGSLMTVMTGGQIEPFFHQVRNHRAIGRRSIMYFACPDPSRRIEPFVVNDDNRHTDIGKLVLDNPQQHFGLSEDFIAS